jgi:D-glycero-D-manno-heptose 1,7-bisphosphate phosphatase
MKKAAFLDRDGVINRKAAPGEYITRWEELEILSQVPEAISMFNAAGWLVVVVTNQRCVAKGLISQQELESLHQRMISALADEGARVDAIYCCPHELDDRCSCRKPAPGLLLNAARDLSIDLKQSWMIGDSMIDIEAGRSAGCQTVFVEEELSETFARADLRAKNLHLAAGLILAAGSNKANTLCC